MTKSSRNANGMGTIRAITRKRKNGKEYILWEGRVTVGYDPGTGKQIQKSIYGKTQREVAQKIRELTVSIDQGSYVEPSKLSVGEWLDIWCDEYLGNIKEATIHIYKQNVRLYLKPSLGAVKLGALSAVQIQKLYNGLEKDSKHWKALSPKSIKNIHGTLHKALQQAVALGYIQHNPTDACVLPKAPKKKVRPLEGKEITDFLEAIEGHRHQVLFTVALFTGMREGELLGLMWDCVDFENNTILIDKQLRKSQEKGGEYYFSVPKNGKERLIAVAPSVMKLLKMHQQEQFDLKAECGEDWIDSGLVFTNEKGDRLSYRTAYDCFKRIVKKIGLAKVRFHDLRHTYAVLALESGDDIKTVQENLGHHSAAFTLDVYGHVSNKMRKKSADRMEQTFREVTA